MIEDFHGKVQSAVCLVELVEFDHVGMSKFPSSSNGMCKALPQVGIIVDEMSEDLYRYRKTGVDARCSKDLPGPSRPDQRVDSIFADNVVFRGHVPKSLRYGAPRLLRRSDYRDLSSFTQTHAVNEYGRE